MTKPGALAAARSPLPYRESTSSREHKAGMFYLSLLRHGWKIPSTECLRCQCFHLCLQAMDVNPSFFPQTASNGAPARRAFVSPSGFTSMGRAHGSQIRPNLCSRKSQAALSLEFSIYSFAELVSFAAVRAIFRTKHHVSTYMWIISYYLFSSSHPQGQIL